jgi:heme A synthase
MFDLRQEGDYADFTSFAAEDVAAWLEQANRFVAEVAGLIARTDP